MDYTNKYQGIYRMWHGRSFPEIRVSKCEYAEEILKSSKHIEKSPTYKLLEPWLGQGSDEIHSTIDASPLVNSNFLCYSFQGSYSRQVIKRISHPRLR